MEEHFTYFQKFKVRSDQELEEKQHVNENKQKDIIRINNWNYRTKAKLKKIIKLSNVNINQDYSLGLPPQYMGSKMFMPSGERLFWQAEVAPQPLGPAAYQDFNEIRSQCLSEGVLFEDPEFPAADSSIFRVQHDLKRRLNNPIKWLRPKDLVVNPHLYVTRPSRFDVNQGYLGDCWLAAALATITLHRSLFYQVVPCDQSFGDDYAGIFHFRFWQYGRWVDVVIDDRLPTSAGKLIFLHSCENDEFWYALLEKAYAKLYGSYGAIVAGPPSEAMEDFTGGLAEKYKVSNLSIDFFGVLLKAYERNSLISASTSNLYRMSSGLRGNHAYSITCVKHVESNIPLLRLRNPWGHHEWQGPWSDKSSEWTRITQERRKSLGFTIKDDGEFWMSFKDFSEHFSTLFICNLNPQCLFNNDCDKKWQMSMFEGRWVAGETAGGSCVDSETYWDNPQYSVSLTNTDAEKCCILIIFLMQKHTRGHNGQKYLSIGFRVHEMCEDENEVKFFDTTHTQHARTRVYSARLELGPGTFLVVPYTAQPNEEGEFLLRVLTEK